MYKDQEIHGTLFIVPAGHDTILGHIWIRKLSICLADIDQERGNSEHVAEQVFNIVHDVTTSLPKELRQEFAKILEQQIGSAPGIKIHLETHPDVKPI